MTHYWLTDRRTGAQYIYNPGQPDHGSSSEDGINWNRPVDDAHLSRRQIIMDEIMADVAHERHQARIEALMKLKAEVDRKTIGEHLMNVLGCAMFAVCLVGCATVVIIGIDAIIKIVRAW